MGRPMILGMSVLATVIATSGCNNSGSPSPAVYNPAIPREWAAEVTHPYFPLPAGGRWEYQGETDEGTETVIVEVLADRRTISGVSAVVVHDRVFLEGDLIEETFDWYAQDLAGNVWYLGEDSREVEEGRVVSAAGSWEWRVDGALPGIVMWADPSSHVGEEYRQEYYEGEAEDWAKVLATDVTAVVPEGNYSGCVKTEDWNALAAGSTEHKVYAPGVGFVLETDPLGSTLLELVSFTTSAANREASK